MHWQSQTSGRHPLVPAVSILPETLCNRIASWLTILSVLGFVSAAKGEDYVELHTEITTQKFSPLNSNPVSTKTYSVRCITGRSGWGIDTDFLQGCRSRWRYDGTNVYEALERTAPMTPQVLESVKRFGLATPSYEIAISNITINIHPSLDGHPLGHEGVNIPWLAFCSGAYLEREPRTLPLPVAVLRHEPYGCAFRDETSAYKDAFSLPSKVELFCDLGLLEGSVHRADFVGNHDTKVWSRTALSNGFRDGELKFRYVVTAATNFLGSTFPLEFRYEQYDFGTNSTWFLRVRGTGKVTYINRSREPESVFLSTKQKTVADYRFQSDGNQVKGLLYRSTNNFPGDTNDPALMMRFDARVAKIKASQVTLAPGARRVWLFLFMITLLLPPALFLFCRRRFTSKGKK